MTKNDFSQDIEGLVDALIQSAGEEKAVYIGTFYGFDVVAKNRCIYLTHPELSAVDALNTARRLTDNLWLQGVNLGIMTSPSEIKGTDSYIHYIEVDRITVRKEKLHSEMTELAKILEGYSSAVLR